MDASCAPADITFPTDVKILNDAREKNEEIIDTLHEPLVGEQKKPCTYREKVRKQFLKITKKKKLSKNQRRKAIRHQLGYINRNLKSIACLSEKSPLSNLDRRQYNNTYRCLEIKVAEGVGFEPTELSLNGFQDRRLKPLGHPSLFLVLFNRTGNFRSTSFCAS